LPIVNEAGPLGMLHLGVDVRFVDDLMLEMLYDVLVVLVVSLFFTLELLHFMAGARLEQALGALGDVFQRGARGEFGTPPRRRGDLAFGSAIQVLEGALARINAGFLALTRDVDAAWPRRRPGCRPWGRVTGSASLRRPPPAPTVNWPRCARRCSSSSWPRN
jgi:HAMP domain-containing protein